MCVCVVVGGAGRMEGGEEVDERAGRNGRKGAGTHMEESGEGVLLQDPL